MKEVACIGSEAFTLGFRLAGINRTMIAEDISGFLKKIEEIRSADNVAIVILDRDQLKKLPFRDRVLIEDSVEPLFISLSKESGSTDLRTLIIRSIGIDIMKEA